MSDERVETHVVVDADEGAGRDITGGAGRDITGGAGRDITGGAGRDITGGAGRRAIHFQEWWVRHHAKLPAHAFVPVGAADAKPGPGVLEAIATADAVILAPSNPVVSIGMVLAVPGVREALRSAPAPVVGLSPIVGGAPVRGMADACLPAIGVATTAEAVGRHYGARSAGGLLDGWLVDVRDAGAEVPGVGVRAVPLMMTDVAAAAAMARVALRTAAELADA